MLDDTTARHAVLKAKLNAVLDEHLDDKDPSMLSQVIGELLADRQSYDRCTVSSTTVPWLLDAYTAAIVGPLAPSLLKLHQFLVRSGASPDKPFDFEHCDRYGVAFADAEWKSMALKTQNYTYMVVLAPATAFLEDAEGNLTSEARWRIHLRICTASRYSYDCARTDFKALEFLRDFDAVYPETGYGDSANEYFRYKDGRDRGYLCSVGPDIIGPGYRTENISWGAAYSYLEGILYDMGCHCSCLPNEDA